LGFDSTINLSGGNQKILQGDGELKKKKMKTMGDMEDQNAIVASSIWQLRADKNLKGKKGVKGEAKKVEGKGYVGAGTWKFVSCLILRNERQQLCPQSTGEKRLGWGADGGKKHSQVFFLRGGVNSSWERSLGRRHHLPMTRN